MAQSSTPEKKALLQKMVSDADLPTSNVVELLASHDTLSKKLTCCHIAAKCTTNTDLALLTANLLLRDASDANPSVRSVSISALASLPGIEESSVRAINSALSDQAALVRRAGALACVRLYSHSPQAVFDAGLVDHLYEGLRDSDPIVITNSILALDTILSEEGGMVVNKNIAHYLLGRLMQFSECNAVYVLTLLLRYVPKSEEELFLLLNALDELLVSKAPGVLLASVKLFLHWTKDHPHLKRDMLEITQASMCRILSRNVPETTYLILDYMQTVGDIREVFGPHYKYFLVRAKDPGYLKTQKLKLLPHVCTESNVCNLIEEVKPFCSDYQSFRGAVKCLGALSQVSATAHEKCLSTLVTLLDAPTERVVIVALECLLSMFPLPYSVKSKTESTSSTDDSPENILTNPQDNETVDMVSPDGALPKKCDSYKSDQRVSLQTLPEDLTAALTRALSRDIVQETDPSLVLCVLGTLSPYLDSAPDILEQMSSLTTLSEAANADLVTAAGRVFLTRPAQTQLLLAAILSKALKSSGAPASRAALVYAALSEGPKNAANLLGANIDHLSFVADC